MEEPPDSHLMGLNFLNPKVVKFSDYPCLFTLGGFRFVVLQKNHELTATRQFTIPSMKHFDDISAHRAFINLIFFRHDYPPFDLFVLAIPRLKQSVNCTASWG